ncbi:hypothetical protein EYD45_13085 [Hyunsoonleella flava]|uniref:Uncharacterized protein n=1 Tax=Hyunsoonleella flava TaxID=2527939 RepID=A0A4Q9FBD4_9FLAO|nr:hypothetical protein [Hyunsoonleella flava]TBN01337.1 hypothetical protein EYD45_13085 [Hyunsoonleella flava]
MNYNVISYIIYIPTIFYIMIYVGWLFYHHGEKFLLNLFHNNKSLVKSINNLLLLGYYLVNLGYAIITIASWEVVESIPDMLNTLNHRLGIIIVGLAVLHYNNVLCLTYLVKSKSLKQ